MADPYVGEIRMFAGDFAPLDWFFCWGQQLKIVEYSLLYSCIGNYYGGDGVVYFNLPDLRGRVPICMGQGTRLSNRLIGEYLGEENHRVMPNEIMHTHPLKISKNNASEGSPTMALLAQPTGGPVLYRSDAAPALVPLHPGSIDLASGDGKTHNNLMPSLAINFIICYSGLFPDPA